MTSRYELIRRLVGVLLANEKNITATSIADAVNSAAAIVKGDEDVDIKRLVQELEASFNVWMPNEATLDNNEDHIPWLPERRLSTKWPFWNRYRRLLEEEKKWARTPLERLGEITDSVLERLEDPHREGAWDRRGMVVGQVQSGKTANYSGLICKAADAGYKLIIVLAGLHNNLRSQTQLRLDESFLGFDTERNQKYDGQNRRVGVGLLKGEPALIAHSLTSSADRGDFNRRVAGQAGIVIGGADPVLLVIKKNKSVLENLYAWATEIRGVQDSITGRTVVRGVPLLLIDDEADNASVNTQPVVDADTGELIADADITQINKLIRKFLNAFEKKAYVGYTATPFANIFIYPETTHPEVGDDLFPKSFIITLPEPTNYVGPVKVFGLAADPDSGIEEQRPLPVIREIDEAGWMPQGHKKDHRPGPLPASLKESIRSFILSCAARVARGQEKEHMSMLVHVTRFTDVQQKVSDLVKKELTALRREIEFGPKAGTVFEDLRKLWDSDFVSTSIDMEGPETQWTAVAEALAQAATKITVRTINGFAEDILDYSRHPNGLMTIAIGGDKLSRGLTLEGLSVSYYLRPSKMYDTLMQMGRWFGYRPGYLDLCRIYTTAELVEWYEHITEASEELRREFEYMASIGKTPKDYGLRVRSHPAGLVITAANKMKTGTTMSVSYAGDITETIQFQDEDVAANLALTERFIVSLGEPNPKRANPESALMWSRVPVETVLAYISEFTTHPGAHKARGPLIANYIKAQRIHSELMEWTVLLVSKKPAVPGSDDKAPAGTVRSHTFGRFEVGLTVRNPDKPGTIKRLLDPAHEIMDLTEEETQEALRLTKENWAGNNSRYKDKVNPPTSPSGTFIREARSATRGLLLIYPLQHVQTPMIGYGVSFPGSSRAKAVEYVVNNTYWEQIE